MDEASRTRHGAGSAGPGETAAGETPPDPYAHYHPHLRFTPWSIIRSILLFAVTALAVVLIGEAETPLWWIAISAVIAALALPVAVRLDRHMPFALAVIVVLIGTVGLGGFIIYRGISEISGQVDTVHADASRVAASMESSPTYGQVASEFGLSDKVKDFFDGLPAFIGGGNTTGTVQSVATSGGALVAIGFLLLLLLAFGLRFVEGGLRQIPDERVRVRVRAVLSDAYSKMSRYLAFMVAKAFAVALVVTVVCQIGGAATPTMFGLWFGAWSLVPVLGLVVAMTPVAVGAAVLGSPWLGLLLLAAAAAVQLYDAMIVQRRIEHMTLRIGPATTLLALIFGFQLYGVGGELVVFYVLCLCVAVGSALKTWNPDFLTAVRMVFDKDLPDETPPGVSAVISPVTSAP